MKKLLFIGLMATGFFVQAQVIENFEPLQMNAMLGGTADSSYFTMVPNPDPTGINTSAFVGKFKRDKDGVPWGGFWSSLPVPVDVTVNKYVHVKVWKPRVSPIRFKLEGGAAGTLELPSMSPQTVTGQWIDVVFDFSSKTGTYPVVAFMPDFEDPLTLTADIDIYFDDIMVNNDSMPGTAAATMIEDFEHIPINLMLGGANDLSTITIVPNPDQSGINTSNFVAKFERDMDGVPWGGFWSSLPMPIDVTSNKYVHVKVWKPRISPVKFKIEGGAAGTLEVASMAPQATINQWEELIFDFSSKTGTYPVIAFLPDFEDPLTLTSDITLYFDDIVLSNAVGINAGISKESLQAYPNPVTDRLFIEISSEMATLDVLNLVGQKVFSMTSVPAGLTTLEVGQLTDGIYVLRFMDSNGSQFTHKFIKR